MVTFSSYGQSGLCDSNTPFYNVNLVGNPGGTWVSSPPVSRAGNCCGTSWPDRCIEFSLNLDTGTIAINFQIISGAIPSGAMYYQINCGPLTAVGTPICISGPYPKTLTFCKPGNNINTYAITAIPKPYVSPTDTASLGCSAYMRIYGVVTSSVTWTSIYPGPVGLYNSYLGCTGGCDSTTATPQTGQPPYVDYRVCGTPLNLCSAQTQFCDTIRIYFNPPLVLNLASASYCANMAGVMLSSGYSGGVPPINFTWTNGSNGTGTIVGTGSTYFATSPGNYSVIVKDATFPACPAKTASITVTRDPLPTANAGPDISICSGNPTVNLNGVITGSTTGIWSGGNGSFSPSSSALNVSYTPSAAEIAAGSVTLILKTNGAGSCPPASDTVKIIINKPLAVLINGPAIVCFGQTASLAAMVTGGTPSYTYSWSNGQTTSSLSSLAAGTYMVTITDASFNTCSVTNGVTITQNPQLTVNLGPSSSVSCTVTQTLSSTAQGGSGAYTYSWNTGQSGSSINVYSGNYIITVTDGSGCTATDGVQVIATNSTLTAAIPAPSVVCYLATTTIQVNAGGGFGSYSYSWSNGNTTQSIVVGAGSYCSTVSDGLGCKITACTNVTQAPQLIGTISPLQTICAGASTNITATATGGTSPYMYSWSTGETNPSVNKSAGTYSVTIVDALGCTRSTSVTILEDPPLTVSLNVFNISCSGLSDGAAVASVSGGAPGYNYSWFPSGATNPIVNGLAAGSHILYVIDSKGCVKTTPFVITSPLPLQASILTSTSALCFGSSSGTAQAGASGGTPAYSYAWSPAGGNGTLAGNLLAGTYTLIVTDSKGCLSSSTVIITQPTQIVINATASDVSCSGGNNGAIVITANGGTPVYNYSWSPVPGGSPVLNGLSSGTYTVQVTDSKGCMRTSAIVITAPSQLTASISGFANPSCNQGSDGSATVSPGGGTGVYSYSWNSVPPQNTATAINLKAQSYTVTITDSNGCSSTSMVTLNDPPALVASASPDVTVLCGITAPVNVSASGGTGPYSYLWSTGSTLSSITVNAGIYTVTTTDSKGCISSDTVKVTASNSTLTAQITGPSMGMVCYGGTTTLSGVPGGGTAPYTYLWNTGGTSSTITAGKGNYCLSITDGLGCLVSNCYVLNEAQQLVISVLGDTACPGGQSTASVSVSGGQPLYNYLWNTGAIGQVITQFPGIYTVTVTDGMNCSVSKSVQIVQGGGLNVGFTKIYNVSCFNGNNGSVTAQVTGGIGSYTYSWSPVSSTSFAVYNLVSGVYTLVVTDSKGCVSTSAVSITQPSVPVTATITPVGVKCYGGSDGALTVTATGGTAPYHYIWWFNGDTTTTLSNIPVNTYTLTIGDANGCAKTVTGIVTQPPALIINHSVVGDTCSASEGKITATINGGTPGYMYSWSNASTTSIASNLAPGSYSVTVTDNNGCKITASAIVDSFPKPIINFSTLSKCLNNPTLFSNTTQGSVSSWLWNFGEPSSGIQNVSTLPSPNHTYSSADTFNVSLTVTVYGSCPFTYSQPLIIDPLAQINYSYFNLCVGSTTTFTDNSSIVSGSILGWSWNFGDLSSGLANLSSLQNPTHIYTAVGSYNVLLTVTSDKGCQNSLSAVVNVKPVPVAVFKTSVLCANQGTVFTDSSYIANGTIVGWKWDFGDGNGSTQSNPTHAYTPPGNYTVSLSVTASNGCIATATSQIIILQGPSADFNVSDVCFGKTVFFNDNSTNPYPIVSRSWDFGNVIGVSTLLSPVYRYPSSGSYKVKLVLEDFNGCIDTASKVLNVFPGPLADFSYLGACEGGTTQFTDLSYIPPGGTISSWMWSFGDGSSFGSSQNESHNYGNNSSSYNVMLTVTSPNGCFDTITKTITIHPLPIVKFSTGKKEACVNDCISFVNDTGFSSLQWDFGDSSLYSTDSNPVHCFTQQGSFTVTLSVTDTFGCKNSLTENAYITIHPRPTADFTLTPSELSILTPFTSIHNLSTGATNWTWDFGDGTIYNGNLKDTTYTYTDNLYSYLVKLVVANQYGCTDTAVRPLKLLPEYAIYIPNAFSPNNDHKNEFFKAEAFGIKDFEMWVFDRWGLLIFHSTDINMGWDGKVQNGKSDLVVQQDVYVWKVKAITFMDEEKRLVGHVTVVK